MRSWSSGKDSYDLFLRFHVRISAFQVGDPGSNPGGRTFSLINWFLRAYLWRAYMRSPIIYHSINV